jgi:hypothetical protein
MAVAIEAWSGGARTSVRFLLDRSGIGTRMATPLTCSETTRGKRS